MISISCDDGKLLRTKQAAEALGVSCNTLRTWANNSLISYQLTPGGHRRFDITSVCHAQQPADRTSNYVRHPLPDPEQEASTGVIYYRVSSSKRPLTFSEFRIQDADATS